MFDNIDNIDNMRMTKTQLSITLILTLFLSITGATYAYYTATDNDNNTITGDMATVNLTLDVNKIFPTKDSINTGVMVPQLSTSGSNNSALSSALKNGCVDNNDNIVCQVYKVDIKNDGGTATEVVDGSIKFYSDSAMTTDVSVAMPNLRWKLITSANQANPSNSVLGANADLVADANNDNIFANDVIITTNSSFTYYLIIWINETNTDQPNEPGESFYAEVSFASSNGTGVTAFFKN